MCLDCFQAFHSPGATNTLFRSGSIGVQWNEFLTAQLTAFSRWITMSLCVLGGDGQGWANHAALVHQHQQHQWRRGENQGRAQSQDHKGAWRAHGKQGWRRSYSKTSCSTREKAAVRADEMALQVEVPVTAPGGLNWILRTHMVEGENQLMKTVLWPPHMRPRRQN